MFSEIETLIADLLQKEKQLDEARIIRLMQIVRAIDPEDVETANHIIPHCGSHLNTFQLRQVIRADITDDEAFKAVETQKTFFSRIANLLPEILNCLKPGSIERTRNAIAFLDDNFVGDLKSAFVGREDKNRRNIKKHLQTTLQRIAALSESFHSITPSFWGVFNESYEAWHDIKKEDFRFTNPFDDLIENLSLALKAIELSIYRAQTEENFLYLPNSQPKTDVRWAHHLSVLWGGPSLSTTPGSKFSHLCSLIYELMFGIAFEGLAGSIGRYSRSKERAEFDLGARWNEEDEIKITNSDNFILKKREAKSSIERALEFERISQVDALGAEVSRSVSRRNSLAKACDRCARRCSR